MTDISLTIPTELDGNRLDGDALTNQGRVVTTAVTEALYNLPEHFRKACKNVKVVHRGFTWQKKSKWTIHYFFQVGKLPELVVMHSTGNMGVPRDHYVLEKFTSEELAHILINGQPRCRGRLETFGLLADIQSKTQQVKTLNDAINQTLMEFSPPELEVREILGPNSDLVLVRPTNTIKTPDQFEEICNRSGYKILGHDVVVAFNKVLEAKLAAVTDLAAMQHDPNHGYIMCVSLRNEDRPRSNVWTSGTGVFEQAIESQAWFIVKSAD